MITQGIRRFGDSGDLVSSNGRREWNWIRLLEPFFTAGPLADTIFGEAGLTCCFTYADGYGESFDRFFINIKTWS